MRAYTISIDVKIIRKGAHEGQTQVYFDTIWNAIHQIREATKDYTLERIRHLLERYEHYEAEKRKEVLANLPPHSLLCECTHRCKAKPRKYWTFLKNEIKWGPDGHVLDDKEEQEWLRIRKTMKQMLSVLVVAKVIPITTATQASPKQ